MTDHTLLPWAVSEHCGMPSRGWIKSVCKGFPEKMVAQILGQETTAEREANTAYIVRACNAFPDLVKVAEVAQRIIDLWPSARIDHQPMIEEFVELRDALARVKDVSKP